MDRRDLVLGENKVNRVCKVHPDLVDLQDLLVKLDLRVKEEVLV